MRVKIDYNLIFTLCLFNLHDIIILINYERVLYMNYSITVTRDKTNKSRRVTIF